MPRLQLASTLGMYAFLRTWYPKFQIMYHSFTNYLKLTN